MDNFQWRILKNCFLTFFTELSHIFDDITDLKFLIIQNEEPSAEILSILDDINLMNNVRYLKTDLSRINFTVKANFNKALGVFAFADKPINFNDESFRKTQENILYICKNFKVS